MNSSTRLEAGSTASGRFRFLEASMWPEFRNCVCGVCLDAAILFSYKDFNIENVVQYFTV